MNTDSRNQLTIEELHSIFGDLQDLFPWLPLRGKVHLRTTEYVNGIYVVDRDIFMQPHVAEVLRKAAGSQFPISDDDLAAIVAWQILRCKCN